MTHHEWIKLYFDEKAAIARTIAADEIQRLVVAVIRCYDRDGTVYVCANGGSAGAAESFATDLKTHPFVSEDKGATTAIRRLRVACLNESAGMITGISNDLGYGEIFVEQLKNHLRGPDLNGNDVFIAFSGSGNSKNVLAAFEYAKRCGVTTTCVAGRDGGRAKHLADICIVVPGTSRFPGQTGKNDNNFHIEDFQMSVTHIVTGLLKEHVATRVAAGA
jgi:D-sedoheptulose 7-phosphate isomerase